MKINFKNTLNALKKYLFILVIFVVVIILFFIFKNDNPKYTTETKIPDNMVIDSKYKVKKINPIELNNVTNPRIYGDNIVYQSDNNLIMYDIKTQKTKLIKSSEIKNYFGDIDVGEKYTIFTTLKSDSEIVYLINILNNETKSILKMKDIEPPASPSIKISGDYAYWAGEKEDESLKRYNIKNGDLENFKISFFSWIDAFGSKILYKDSLNDSQVLREGDLNRLIVQDLDSKIKINLPEDETLKNDFVMSESYVAWVSRLSSQYDIDLPEIKIYSIDNGGIQTITTLNERSLGRKNLSYLSIFDDKLIYISNFGNEDCLYLYDIKNKQENKIMCGGGLIYGGGYKKTDLYKNKIVVEWNSLKKGEYSSRGDSIFLVEF